MRIRELLTILYFFLAIYSFSGGAVHGVANYSAWKLIGAEDFPAVHRYVNRRVFLVYVPFFFLSVLVNIDKLVAVHLYLRLIPGVVVMIVTAAMMYQTFGVTGR